MKDIEQILREPEFNEILRSFVKFMHVRVPEEVENVLKFEDGFEKLMDRFISQGLKKSRAFDEAVSLVRKYYPLWGKKKTPLNYTSHYVLKCAEQNSKRK